MNLIDPWILMLLSTGLLGASRRLFLHPRCGDTTESVRMSLSSRIDICISTSANAKITDGGVNSQEENLRSSLQIAKGRATDRIYRMRQAERDRQSLFDTDWTIEVGLRELRNHGKLGAKPV